MACFCSCFSRTEVCKEPEIIKKYKYTLKLIPMNPHVRTYYISVGSERELMVSSTLHTTWGAVPREEGVWLGGLCLEKRGCGLGAVPREEGVWLGKVGFNLFAGLEGCNRH